MDALGILIFVLLISGVGYWFYKMFKGSVELKTERSDVKDRTGASLVNTLKHVSGLPIVEGTMVEVYYGGKSILFKTENKEISIPMEKVMSIDSVTGKNIQGQVTGGAIAGKYILGGAAGAVIGSLVASTVYLVISYKSDGEDKSIILDTAFSGLFSSKIEKDFKENYHRETEKIEL